MAWNWKLTVSTNGFVQPIQLINHMETRFHYHQNYGSFPKAVRYAAKIMSLPEEEVNAQIEKYNVDKTNGDIENQYTFKWDTGAVTYYATISSYALVKQLTKNYEASLEGAPSPHTKPKWIRPKTGPKSRRNN